eukprot:gene7848-7278_t
MNAPEENSQFGWAAVQLHNIDGRIWAQLPMWSGQGQPWLDVWVMFDEETLSPVALCPATREALGLTQGKGTVKLGKHIVEYSASEESQDPGHHILNVAGAGLRQMLAQFRDSSDQPFLDC